MARNQVQLDIERREPFAGGSSFGDTGPYERLYGKAHFAIDPDEKGLPSIVDLDLAPRNAQGLVEFAATLDIIKPVELSRGIDVSSTSSPTAATAASWALTTVAAWTCPRRSMPVTASSCARVTPSCGPAGRATSLTGATTWSPTCHSRSKMARCAGGRAAGVQPHGRGHPLDGCQRWRRAWPGRPALSCTRSQHRDAHETAVRARPAPTHTELGVGAGQGGGQGR